MREARKLNSEVRLLNDKVNKLDFDTLKLKSRHRIYNGKIYLHSKEFQNLKKEVYRLKNQVRKLNHEVMNPNNEVQKLRGKVNMFNETAQKLRDEVNARLQMPLLLALNTNGKNIITK